MQNSMKEDFLLGSYEGPQDGSLDLKTISLGLRSYFALGTHCKEIFSDSVHP